MCVVFEYCIQVEVASSLRWGCVIIFDEAEEHQLGANILGSFPLEARRCPIVYLPQLVPLANARVNVADKIDVFTGGPRDLAI